VASPTGGPSSQASNEATKAALPGEALRPKICDDSIYCRPDGLGPNSAPWAGRWFRVFGKVTAPFPPRRAGALCAAAKNPPGATLRIGLGSGLWGPASELTHGEGPPVTESLVDVVRAHHTELRRKLLEKVEAWLGTGSPEAFQDLTNFLSGELLSHARAEEAHLYPAVEPLVKAWGRATATMSIDHEFIEDYIRRIQAWPDPETRRELVLGLQAIFTLHLEKEERVYLPLIADHLPAEEQARVLKEMHAGSGPDPGGEEPAEAILDVRAIPPRERHPPHFRNL